MRRPPNSVDSQHILDIASFNTIIWVFGLTLLRCVGVIWLVHEADTIVCGILCDSEWKTTGLDQTVKNIDDGVSALLTGETSV